MRSDDYGRVGLTAATVALAILVYIASCTAARAGDYEALWLNSDPTTAAHWVKLCDRAGCSRAVAVDCAPGATCRTRFADPPAARNVYVASSADGSVWSIPSNAIDTDVCLISPACRLDVDRDGLIGGTDFAEFVRWFGARSR